MEKAGHCIQKREDESEEQEEPEEPTTPKPKKKKNKTTPHPGGVVIVNKIGKRKDFSCNVLYTKTFETDFFLILFELIMQLTKSRREKDTVSRIMNITTNSLRQSLRSPLSRKAKDFGRS